MVGRWSWSYRPTPPPPYCSHPPWTPDPRRSGPNKHPQVERVCEGSTFEHEHTHAAPHYQGWGATVTSLSSSHLIFTVILSVLRVPYSDHNVTGAEMEIGVISDVVDANILLCAQNLEGRPRAV